jgi:LysR family positive regulator for ilvC
MNHKELQLFLHLSKSLSFARTSEACHVTPSSLSRVIQRLEQEVGQALFERDSRRVTLTDTGKAFRVFAEEACNSWSAFRQSLLDGARHLQGELSLFCSVTASYSFLDEILSQFRAEYPGIEMKLHTGDSAMTLDRVSTEVEDIGIAALPDVLPAQFATLELTKTPLVFIAPVKGDVGLGYSGEGAVDWQKLPLVLSESGLARERVDRWFRANRVKPNVYAQVTGNEAIVSMVGLGFGVGLVPRIVLENSPFAAKVKVLSIKHDIQPFTIGLCVLKRKLNNPLIEAFWRQAGESIAGNKKL